MYLLILGTIMTNSTTQMLAILSNREVMTKSETNDFDLAVASAEAVPTSKKPVDSLYNTLAECLIKKDNFDCTPNS